MSKITRVPRGIQEYLGTQNQGDNPNELLQSVQPVVDFTRFYDVEKKQFQNIAFSPTAIDTTFDFQIPDDEIWIVDQAGAVIVFAGATAGDSADFAIGAWYLPNSNSGANIHAVANFGKYVWTSAATKVLSRAIDPVLLWGGAFIRGYVTDVSLTAGAINGAITLQYTRLRF